MNYAEGQKREKKYYMQSKKTKNIYFYFSSIIKFQVKFLLVLGLHGSTLLPV